MASQNEDQGQSRVSAAFDEAQAKAREAGETVEALARDYAEHKKAAGADQVRGAADAMHAAAGEPGGQAPLASEYVENAAGQLDAVASTLRERSIDEIVGKLADYARKQPVMFFAGAVATGFALSRLLKSSANKS